MVEIAERRQPALAATAWLKPLPPAGRWVLHGGAEARARVAPVWGVGFSEEPCRAHAGADRATLWMGPDEYLLLDLGAVPGAGAEEARSALAQSLEEALSGTAHALVDVSHRQFALEINGPHAAGILNGACPLDLDPRAFPTGMCTRTVLGKADILLWRTGADVFRLEAWRSFADYVCALLGEIARDFSGAPP